MNKHESGGIDMDGVIFKNNKVGMNLPADSKVNMKDVEFQDNEEGFKKRDPSTPK